MGSLTKKDANYRIMPNNEMKWSSNTPGEIIFLLDQSGSMTQSFVNGESRSEFACKAINSLIDDIIQRNSKGFEPKNRAHIAVIGYNSDVQCILDGFLNEINEMNVEEYEDGVPMWIKPTYEDGATNMKDAFELAKKIIEKWITTCPNNPAPVIINISDGHPYYNNMDYQKCMQETKDVVNQIKKLDTHDGKVQIFNVMIGNGDPSCVVKFPINDNDCKNDESRFLFDISTQIPESYIEEARHKFGITCEQGAKGVIYQANDTDIVDLIRFGSTMA